MMDRHLIYPPGWEKQPKNDWDADPSLKGKPVPIQGTNLNLDKPEDLDAWIADRKRRWPTAPRVEEKKRKLDEAIARGQLPVNLAIGNKRQRTDEDSTESDDDDDCPPEVISSKAPVEPISPGAQANPISNEQKRASNPNRQKRPAPRPKREPHNPFASRPTLLRNLLLPEIRMTISNLSQAIRFLVDNDFMEGVEATPGAADSTMIQVISDHPSATPAPASIK
ncbi:hypothetical protein DXG03_007100 [Asterophora parasitica]|uniref:FMR1-interacting protein 1 conserved domain-containing protein n=1 Tax=Asterophora parasitica TaxID=117018 RepID=A0A9P7GEY3_9AGAR|nr:hypothetical protein DXG03_007100 [Asterophora parasitica]